MKHRVPLQIVEGRLVLTAVVECPKLRIYRQIMEFVIDTGSQNSYFGYKDVMRLQIPLSEKGFISDSKGRKFIYLTNDGIKKAEELKTKFFGELK